MNSGTELKLAALCRYRGLQPETQLLTRLPDIIHGGELIAVCGGCGQRVISVLNQDDCVKKALSMKVHLNKRVSTTPNH